jgi:hypothetical protein
MNPTPNELAGAEWAIVKAVWDHGPDMVPTLQPEQNPKQPGAICKP